MKLFQIAGGWRVLRRLLRQQERTNVLLERLCVAADAIAASQRIQAQAQLGGGEGFVTGLPDGKDDAGLIRGSNADTLELLEMEAVLQQKWGRPPTDEETVQAWQEWKGTVGR